MANTSRKAARKRFFLATRVHRFAALSSQAEKNQKPVRLGQLYLREIKSENLSTVNKLNNNSGGQTLFDSSRLFHEYHVKSP